jgi:hypothetical protein
VTAGRAGHRPAAGPEAGGPRPAVPSPAVPRSTAAAIAAAMVMVVVAAAVRAAWDSGDGPDAVAATSTSTTVAVTPTPEATVPATPTTEGTTVTFLASSTTTAPAPTTTAVVDGLPASLPFPGPGVVTLSGDSTYATTFEVAGVPAVDVLDWLVGELAAAGWEVVGITAGIVSFTGPGAVGVALVGGDDPVAVAVQLGAPPG